LGALALSVGVFGSSTIGAAPTAQIPTCFGRPATIVAESRRAPDGDFVFQRVAGTAGPDVIVTLGSGGGIVIEGLGGNDFICGAGEEVYGGDGNDRIAVTGGMVQGGPGNDFLQNTSNVSIVFDGNLGFRGDDGDDTLIGSNFREVLLGDAGNDTVRGRGGDDELIGGDGADLLIAGAGNDEIDGGAGRDNCDGGKNRDTATECEIRTNIP
jgi:Ca2+-binding RTX toxin-like protein